MDYYLRHIDSYLMEWAMSDSHKPMLLRGARQVGKSTAVRHLSTSFKSYIEVNLEQRRDLHKLFGDDLNIDNICAQLGAIFGVSIVDGETLLFIDEIQSCPRAIASLRYFYEQRPGLHVIAAGSLLEFALAELPSFGVGRISSLFLYPFSFDEFLSAQGLESLVQYKRMFSSPDRPLPDTVYRQLVEQFKYFLLIGGMPEAVATWIEHSDYNKCLGVQNDILNSYRDDFAKYKSRISPVVLWLTLNAVAVQSGQKFVYSRVDDSINSKYIKEAVSLLELAGIILKVTHTSANGVPLGAEINEKYRKFVFMDSGLLLAMLHVNPSDILLPDSSMLVNKGGVAEVTAGLELTKYSNPRVRSEMFYWQRSARNSLAEVDYVKEINRVITPIEVKSGVKGGMQSLRIFLEEKKIARGIRTSLENFAEYNNIQVYPLFALSNLVSLPTS